MQEGFKVGSVIFSMTLIISFISNFNLFVYDGISLFNVACMFHYFNGQNSTVVTCHIEVFVCIGNSFFGLVL